MGNSTSTGDSDHSPVSIPTSPSASQHLRGMKDARGIERGGCRKCPHCTEFIAADQQEGGQMSVRCTCCNCPPGVHENLSAKQACGDRTTVGMPTPPASTIPDFVPQVSTATCTAANGHFYQGPRCSYPGCSQQVEFDLNTGTEFACCRDHLHATMPYSGSNTVGYQLQQPPYMAYIEPGGTSQPQPMDGSLNASYPSTAGQFSPPPSLPPVLPGGSKKCAIPECPNPCHVDESGTVHECCGYTHAMEHQRRLTIQQQSNQQIVKGVTHCLLPGCSNPTWPFENYCGRTHANIGKQQGIKPPLPSVDTSAPQQDKDSSLCIFPQCSRPKFVDGSITHPYCGRTHAEQGKQLGIVPSADRVEDQCEFPGCTKPKRKEGTRVHDYCCRDHADQDAPNRDARILTSYSEVQNFLNKFTNLTVVSINENPDSKAPGGKLFQRFKSKMLSLPKHQRNTCLAFHGTSEGNISSICQNGYDPKLRSGQAHGAGEYFATTPDIPLTYCKGGKKLLLNELLLGQSGTHHTQHGAIVVMKDPAHDLPRYIITFK